MSTAPIRGLLREPHPTIPDGFVSERWIRDTAPARRRLRQLGDAGIHVSKRRAFEEIDGKLVRCVDYTYTDPKSVAPVLDDAMVPSSRVYLPEADERGAA